MKYKHFVIHVQDIVDEIAGKTRKEVEQYFIRVLELDKRDAEKTVTVAIFVYYDRIDQEPYVVNVDQMIFARKTSDFLKEMLDSPDSDFSSMVDTIAEFKDNLKE